MKQKASNPKYNQYRQIKADYGVKDLPALSQVLPNNPNSKFTIVELGCGAGHISATIAQRYPEARIIATDLMQECLEVARQNYPELEFEQVDAEGRFPFKDSSVDFVVSSNLYEHLHDEKRHLQEIKRVRRDGGFYFIATPHFFFDTLWWSLAAGQGKRLRAVWRRMVGDPRTAHCNLQTKRSLKKTLRASGFTVEVLKRSRFSNTERKKLESLVKWLPMGLRLKTVRFFENIWLRMPSALQPAIVVAARKL